MDAWQCPTTTLVGRGEGGAMWCQTLLSLQQTDCRKTEGQWHREVHLQMLQRRFGSRDRDLCLCQRWDQQNTPLLWHPENDIEKLKCMFSFKRRTIFVKFVKIIIICSDLRNLVIKQRKITSIMNNNNSFKTQQPGRIYFVFFNIINKIRDLLDALCMSTHISWYKIWTLLTLVCWHRCWCATSLLL